MVSTTHITNWRASTITWSALMANASRVAFTTIYLEIHDNAVPKNARSHHQKLFCRSSPDVATMASPISAASFFQRRSRGSLHALMSSERMADGRTKMPSPRINAHSDKPP